MNKKTLIFFLLLLLINWEVRGQDILLKANYPPVVTEGEQFAISWNVNAGGGDFTAPSFQGFYKLAGPQTSYSSSTTIVNGKVTQQTSYTYVYYLQAMEAGRFTLGPATIKIKNKEYRSDSLYIEVVKDQAARPQTGNNQQTGDAGGDRIAGNDLFVRLVISKSDVYQGEHITASLKIYSRIDLGGLSEVKYPDFNGFIKEDLQTQPLSSLQRENVNGVIYGTGVIQQFLLFPQRTGEITINPVEVTALLQQKTGNNDPFFGDFFATYTNVPKILASQPVKINVKPLPGNKPADFSGIVGKIELETSLAKDSVNVNDALNYRITIRGRGNLRLAGKPDFKMAADVEVFEPKISDRINNGTSGSSGEKIFEYVLIPRHYGSFTIPSVSYTYFNTETGKYERLTGKEYTFYARKTADAGGSNTVFSGVSKEDVKYLGKDIRFVKTDTGSFKPPRQVLVEKASFFAWFGIAFMIFILILILRRETVRRNADIAAVRNRKAGKVAAKRLRSAEKLLQATENDKFYEELLKALWGYLSDKLNIPLAELNRSTVADMLRKRNIEENAISELTTIIDECEFARYAPAAAGKNPEELFHRASEFIGSIEKTI